MVDCLDCQGLVVYDWGMALNPKQQAFCREYIVDWNATQAAIRAGYSPKTSGSQSSLLLKKQNIQDEIDKIRDELLGTERKHLQYQVLKELKAIAFTNITDVVSIVDGSIVTEDTKDLEQETKSAIEEISQTSNAFGGSTKIKMHSKTKALELLGKYAGLENMNAQKVEVTIADLSDSERAKRIAELEAKRNGVK